MNILAYIDGRLGFFIGFLHDGIGVREAGVYAGWGISVDIFIIDLFDMLQGACVSFPCEM